MAAWEAVTTARSCSSFFISSELAGAAPYRVRVTGTRFGLTWRAERLELRYTALSLRAPELVTFRCGACDHVETIEHEPPRPSAFSL